VFNFLRCPLILVVIVTSTLFLVSNPTFSQYNLPKQEADSLYQQGLYSEATEAYQRLVQQWQAKNQPDSVHYYQYWQAKSYIQQYEYSPARQLLEGILAQTDTTTDNSLLSKVYHETGYTYLGESDIDQALRFSEKSIAAEQGRTQPDTFQLAKYFEFRGFLMMQSGQYDEAEQRVKQAHRLRKQILEPTDKELGYSANTLYIVMDALGNLSAADTAIAEAWSILNQHLPEDHPHIAVIANNYSTHLLDMGEPQQAKNYLLTAIASNQSGERYVPLVGNYVNLGMLYLNLGEHKTAESYYRQAWEIADTLLAYPHYQRTAILDALGAVYYYENQLAPADSVFRRSLAEKRDVYDEQSAEVAQSIYNLGLIATERQELPQAQAYFRQAENMRERVLGSAHPKRADALYELGSIAWEYQDTTQALVYWRDSQSIYEQALGLSHHHSLETLLQLTEAFTGLNQHDSADYYLNRAWASASGQAPDSLTFDSLSIQQYHPFVLDLINFQLRDYLLKQTLSPDELNRLANILTAVQVWLPTFQSLFNDASLWEGVADQIREVYQRGAVLVHRALAQANSDQTFWQNQLLNCIQASRGTTIQAAFKDREAVKFAGVPDSTIALGNELKQQLQFALAREQNDDEEDLPTQMNEQRQTILQRWQEYQQQLRTQYPQYYQARFEPQLLDLQQLQQTLREQAYSVLAYFHLDTALLAV